MRDKRHGCERFEGWLGSKHQPRAQCKKPLTRDQGLFNLVVGESPATDSSMNVRKTGCACSCVPMRKVLPGRILPLNPLGSITFRRSRLDTNLHHCPTGAKHPCTAKTSQTTPQDLLTYQNGALMGSARFITSENHSKADMYDSIYLVD